MSILSVYHVSSPELPNKVLTHFEDIASTLAEHGVGLRRLQATVSVGAGASQQAVLSSCREPVDALMAETGYTAIDVISADRDHPQKAELRARFLEEHQHHEDELRAVITGRGLFYLRGGDFVYALLCERNDLVSIPAGTRQWLDIGEHPQLVMVRLFNTHDGLTAAFTGDAVAGQFPSLED